MGLKPEGLAGDFLKRCGCHRLAQDLVAVYSEELGVCQAGTVHDMQTRKCHKQNTKVAEFTGRPKRQREAWHCVGAQSLPSCTAQELRKEAPVSSLLPDCLRAHPHFSVLMLALAVPLLEGIRRAVAVSVDARGLVCGTGRSHQLGTQANSFAVSVTTKWLLP